MIDIKPIHTVGLDCLEELVISVAAHFNREYQLAFAEAFTFEYIYPSSEKDLLGNCLRIGSKNILPLVKQYCGISIKRVETKSYEKAIKVIKEQLQIGQPTAIYIDTYYCPWHNLYQKYSTAHTCLAIGIDLQRNLICIDPSLGLNTFLLPSSDFMNGFGASCGTFSVEEPVEVIKYQSILQDSIKNIGASNIFMNMETFIHDFKMNMEFDKEFQNAHISFFQAPLHRNLSYIYGERLLYFKFIKYIYDKTLNINLLDIIDRLEYLGSKWQRVVSLLMKAYYAGFTDKTKEKLCNTFNDILDMERRIYNNLHDIVNTGHISSLKQDSSLKSLIKTPYEYVYIDLKKHLNNIGFHSICSNECLADFTGIGNYFIAKNTPSGQVISLDNLKFSFPLLCDNVFDNISCNNQNLIVPASKYKGIMILGCAEWGSFIEYLNLNFKNIDSQRIQINFSDWNKGEPLYDEKIAWCGNIFDKRQNKLSNDSFNIYALYRPIISSDVLTSITLPECSNIHIFSITLCK